MRNIHTNIKVLRQEARLSQEEFAEQIGTTIETVKLWEKGKLDPTDDEITKMCPVLRIHKEDFLERDILTERTSANAKMKKNYRSNYNWYYGNRLHMAFYISYLILIPIAIIGGYFIASIFYSAQEELLNTTIPYKTIYQIGYGIGVGGTISTIYVLIYVFKKGIIKFQWWFLFFISFAISLLIFICSILLIVLYGFAFYKGIIKKGKNY